MPDLRARKKAAQAGASHVNIRHHGSHGQRGNPIAPYVWCIIGAVLGYLGGSLSGDGSLVTRLEAVGVGVFGAFMGGEFIASYVLKPEVLKTISAPAAGMAVAGAVVALVLLKLMRRAVGPMKVGKSRRRE